MIAVGDVEDRDAAYKVRQNAARHVAARWTTCPRERSRERSVAASGSSSSTEQFIVLHSADKVASFQQAGVHKADVLEHRLACLPDMCSIHFCIHRCSCLIAPHCP